MTGKFQVFSCLEQLLNTQPLVTLSVSMSINMSHFMSTLITINDNIKHTKMWWWIKGDQAKM